MQKNLSVIPSHNEGRQSQFSAKNVKITIFFNKNKSLLGMCILQRCSVNRIIWANNKACIKIKCMQKFKKGEISLSLGKFDSFLLIRFLNNISGGSLY